MKITKEYANGLPKELEVDIKEELIDSGYIDYETAFFQVDGEEDIIDALDSYLMDYFGFYLKTFEVANIDYILGTVKIENVEWGE